MRRPLGLWSDGQLEAAAKSEDIIRRFAVDVTEDGGRLVLVYAPHPWQVGRAECALGRYYYNIAEAEILPPTSGTQEWLVEIADRHGIELLDPTEAMREYASSVSGDEQLLFLRSDCHWSDVGHQWMADFLVDWYLDR
jgi:hypothetical protein